MEFEEKCVPCLDAQWFQSSFSNNCFEEFLKIIATDYKIRLARPVDFERNLLEKHAREQCFHHFGKNERWTSMSRIDPKFWWNWPSKINFRPQEKHIHHWYPKSPSRPAISKHISITSHIHTNRNISIMNNAWTIYSHSQRIGTSRWKQLIL